MSNLVLIKDNRENKDVLVNKEHVVVLRPISDQATGIYLVNGISVESNLTLEELREKLS